MSLYIWRNFKIEIPKDWEMLQFSKNFKEGRCAFADRYQIRLELDWNTVAGAPDMERLISDYRNTLFNKRNMKDAHIIKQKPWYGIEGHIKDLYTTRYMRFMPTENCVLQVIFIWPKEKNNKLEHEILESIKESTVHQKHQRWKAFGMDLLASKELSLKACKAAPASAGMIFSMLSSSKINEDFRRLGMVKHWLNGTIKEWLMDQVPDSYIVEKEFREQISGHNIENVCCVKSKGYFSKLLKKSEQYKASAWICPFDERLYYVSSMLSDENLPFAGKRLSCCEKLGLDK